MPLLVHIAPANQMKKIARNGIAPRRIPGGGTGMAFPVDRAVWAFPVLPSYTLSYGWSRELKRWGATSLAAVTFRIPDGEQVLARHFGARPAHMSAASAAGFVASAHDPRGYEIIVPRRIHPNEIVRVRPLPKAVGWRYEPDAKGKAPIACDCPMCLPRGEVNAGRFRERVYARMRKQSREPEVG
jgi:hypothetical protein